MTKASVLLEKAKHRNDANERVPLVQIFILMQYNVINWCFVNLRKKFGMNVKSNQALAKENALCVKHNCAFCTIGK